MQPDEISNASADLEFQLTLLRLANLARRGGRRTPSLEEFFRLLAHDHPGCAEAAKDYFQSTARAVEEPKRFITNKRIVEAVDELLFAKRADGLSQRYIETLRSHLRRFGRVFDAPIGNVKAADIEHWLRGLPIQARARNNMRASIVTLFRFAQKHNYLSRGAATEADEVAKAKDRGGAIGILSPDQLRRALASSRQELRLFLALGAFTGMRSSELLRLEWSEVNLSRHHIVVAAEKAKTATRRLVPILPNLREWLKPYSHATGRLFRSRRTADRAIAVAKASRIVWPNNALRHSYATYRLAVTADAARVALEMGNSPQKLITNYRELADPEESQRWFSIIPTDYSVAIT